MTWLLLALACARPGNDLATETTQDARVETTESAPTVLPAGDEETNDSSLSGAQSGATQQEIDACMQECLVQNQMRSVGYELIEADCRTSCTGTTSPLGTQPLDPESKLESP